ncbi:MAG TPA: hypothetical protein VLV90_10225 [Burkholderiales bacterium]|nr:hypothetical protein [Burkholderiales bacterium]
MQCRIPAVLAASALLALPAAAPAQVRVTSQQTVGGFVHVESVSYDPAAKALYLSEFGTAQLNPLLKDGMGRIVKTDLDGKVLDKQFLPAAGGEKLNKPKGNWVQGDRFWVTDIDVVWVFDLKTKKGRKLALPGAQFANDSAVMDGALYVSDNRSDQVYKIEPADFLHHKGEPKVTSMFIGKGVNPNGVYPARDGELLMAGYLPPSNPKGFYTLGVSGQVKAISDPIGFLDGLYQMADGSLLATDWKSGSLFHWSEKGGMQKLADGFKGPADFCVFPVAGGLTVVVPDLVQGQLRFVQLRK